MNGGGIASIPKTTPHSKRHLNWFYVYFGYSKPKAQAYAFIKWTNDDNSLDW